MIQPDSAGAACFDGAELSVTFAATQGTGWSFFIQVRGAKKDKESEDDFLHIFSESAVFLQSKNQQWKRIREKEDHVNTSHMILWNYQRSIGGGFIFLKPLLG